MDYPWLHTDQTSLIYIGDPMCSWCYGFAPEVTKLKTHFEHLDFRIIVGGLRPGGTETMADLAPFLDRHWKEVEDRSNQPFNYKVLTDQSFIMDTEPSCRAVVVFRQFMPEKELDYFKAVQHAFFIENKPMNKLETFTDLLPDFGIDKQEFIAIYASPVCKWDTEDDFQVAIEMGIQGFPSVAVKHGDQFYLVSNGFIEAGNLIKNIEQVLKKESESTT